jgi:hypothetical protein
MSTFNRLSRRRSIHHRNRKTRQSRLFVEELEPRRLLATITYAEGTIIGGQPYEHNGTSLWQNDPHRNDSQYVATDLTGLLRMGRGRHSPPGQAGFNGSLRTLMSFPLDGLPAGARILNVALTMHVFNYDDPSGARPSIELHEYSGPNVSETSATWNSTGGGTYVPDLLSVSPGAAIGPIEFASTSSFVAAAQRALDNAQALGIILVSPDAEAHTQPFTPEYIYRFHSDDAISAGLHPQLTVEYEPAVAPAVTDVRVRFGSQSHSLLGNSRNLPWVNIDAVDVVFDQGVVVDMNDLRLGGVQVSQYALQNFNYNQDTRTATWRLASPLVADRLRMSLDGDDASDGNLGVSSLDAVFLEGGDFLLDFNVLPGDYNGDGVVTIQDSLGIRNRSPGFGLYDIFADLDGDGDVDLDDINHARRRLGSRLR